MSMILLALFACNDFEYGEPIKSSDTGSEETGDTGSSTSYPITTQVTLVEGHFVVNQGGSWTDLWLDGNGGEYFEYDADPDQADFQVIGNPDEGGGWFYVDVQYSAYTVNYRIDSGFRVDLSCDDESYDYCWNGGGATQEVFGVSGYP